MQQAILAGGCFWCLEAVFLRLKGVVSVASGYIGGTPESADYQSVCSGQTEHAEAVKIDFDPSQISYLELLEVFFDIHDPTQLNRQGHDIGRQYRSAIFYLNEQQQQEALRQIDQVSAQIGTAVVTEVVSASEFFEAEAYHQNYYIQNTQQPYCQVVISPKLEKLAKRHEDKLSHLENSRYKSL